MKNSEFEIRPLQEGDLLSAMEIKNGEGWNQTLKDWEFLFNDKPGMCLVALHRDKVVATVSAIGYENKLAWIGMMLVRKEYRRMGLAKSLMSRIISVLKEYESIKLDATPAGVPVYHDLGFVPEATLYRMVRPFNNLNEQKDPHVKIKTTGPESLQEIVDFDRKNYGVNRQNLLRYLYNQSPGTVRIIKEDSSIKGYIMGRPGTNYYQLGPLVAESTEASIALLAGVLSDLRGQAVVVDVFKDRKPLIKWLHSKGFVQQRELIRMYYQNNPYPGEIRRQYLISGPELG